MFFKRKRKKRIALSNNLSVWEFFFIGEAADGNVCEYEQELQERETNAMTGLNKILKKYSGEICIHSRYRSYLCDCSVQISRQIIKVGLKALKFFFKFFSLHTLAVSEG